MNRKRPSSKVFVGTVVTLKGNNITMKSRDGKKRTLLVAEKPTIISDGMPSALDELHVGQNIRVTTRSKDFNIVEVIESLRNNVTFPSFTEACG